MEIVTQEDMLEDVLDWQTVKFRMNLKYLPEWSASSLEEEVRH